LTVCRRLKYTTTVMEPPPRLLVLGAGPFQGELIEAAGRLGVTTLAMDRDPLAAALPLADVFVQGDVADVSAVVARAKGLELDGVVSAATDIALPAQAAVAQALGLPGPTPEVIALARDKLKVAQRLTLAGVSTPETVAADVGSPGEVGGFPLVVKPATGAGGRGVSVVDDAHALEAARHAAGRHGAPLLQRFVTGEPMGLEAFLREGVVVGCFAFTDQLRPPFPSPIGHATPPTCHQDEAHRLEALARDVARALGLRDGGLNLDLRWTADGPTVLEVNPRSGGALLGPLVRQVYGVDLCAAAVALALGWPTAPHLKPTRLRPGASRFFVAFGRGRARRIDGHPGGLPAALVGDERLVAHHLDPLRSDAVGTTVGQWSILGHCLVQADTTDEAIAFANEIDDHVRASVEVEP
jgi:biotin carboxylase